MWEDLCSVDDMTCRQGLWQYWSHLHNPQYILLAAIHSYKMWIDISEWIVTSPILPFMIQYQLFSSWKSHAACAEHMDNLQEDLLPPVHCMSWSPFSYILGNGMYCSTIYCTWGRVHIQDREKMHPSCSTFTHLLHVNLYVFSLMHPGCWQNIWPWTFCSSHVYSPQANSGSIRISYFH